jgi:hypothetical protein
VDKRVTDDVDLNVKNLKPLGVISDSIFRQAYRSQATKKA